MDRPWKGSCLNQLAGDGRKRREKVAGRDMEMWYIDGIAEEIGNESCVSCVPEKNLLFI